MPFPSWRTFSAVCPNGEWNRFTARMPSLAAAKNAIPFGITYPDMPNTEKKHEDAREVRTGDRLRAVADRLHGGNKSDLARSLGMKPSSFSKYLDGNRRPGAVVLEKLTRLGVNINWLLTGDGAMLGPPSLLSSSMSSNSDNTGRQYEPGEGEREETRPEGASQQFHRIPLVRIRDDSEEGLRLVETGRSEWIGVDTAKQQYGVDPSLLLDFHVSGDSMAPTIQPGDQVRAVLWDCRSPNDGTVCIIRGPVCFLIRRIRLSGEQILLMGDNPEVPDREIPRDKWKEEFEAIARILEVRRAL